MVTAITPNSREPMAAVNTRLAEAAPAAVPQASPAIEEAARPALTLPKRAEIKVDPETMRRNLQEAISRLNDLMRDGGRGLQFSIDSALDSPVILVKNQESGEVIRQIPAAVVVHVAHSIEALKGLLHNETV